MSKNRFRPSSSGASILSAFIGITLLLSACNGDYRLQSSADAETAFEVGHVFVSPLPPIPWADIATSLEPKHNLTTEQATNLAATTTQAELGQFLSAFSAGLGIGLPVATNLINKVTTAEGLARTQTRTRQQGIVPESSGTPSSAIDPAALVPDLSRDIANVPIDAGTLLTAGTAIYQQAKILDNQITKAFYPKGYSAQLLTLQVSLQPRRRDLAFDAYTVISLLPGSWKEAKKSASWVNSSADGLPPVIVYPLVISENLETTSAARSLETMRQFALQLSGTVSVVGVNAGVQSGNNKLESVIGSDRNSLLTVGRANDHTVQVRFGAPNSASADFAMVPRSFNVSLVVLTREKDGRVSKLRVTSNTRFVGASDGKALRAKRDVNALALNVQNRLAQFGFVVSGECNNELDSLPRRNVKDADAEKKRTDSRNNLKQYLGVLRAAVRGDYATLSRCLQLKDKPVMAHLGLAKPAAGDEKVDGGGVKTEEPEEDSNKKADGGEEQKKVVLQLTLMRLVASLAAMNLESRYSTFVVALPDAAKPPALPPETQLALFADDGKLSSLVLYGGKRLTKPKQIEAALCTQRSGDGTCIAEFAAIAPITISGAGAKLISTYPSLKALKLSFDDMPEKILMLKLGEKLTSYKALALAAPATKTAVTNPVTATHNMIVADALGNGKVTLFAGKFTAGTPLPIRIVVGGADVRSAAPSGVLAIAGTGLQILKSGVFTLELGNLSAASKVTIKTMNAEKKPVGPALEFTVERRDVETR